MKRKKKIEYEKHTFYMYYSIFVPLFIDVNYTYILYFVFSIQNQYYQKLCLVSSFSFRLLSTIITTVFLRMDQNFDLLRTDRFGCLSWMSVLLLQLRDILFVDVGVAVVIELMNIGC